MISKHRWEDNITIYFTKMCSGCVSLGDPEEIQVQTLAVAVVTAWLNQFKSSNGKPNFVSIDSLFKAWSIKPVLWMYISYIL